MTGGSVTLLLSELATQFLAKPFLLRLHTRGDAKPLRVRPVCTAGVQDGDCAVLASTKLRKAGALVPAVIGTLRVETRTDASDGSACVPVTVFGEDGPAQARFSQDEWCDLMTNGIIEDIEDSIGS